MKARHRNAYHHLLLELGLARDDSAAPVEQVALLIGRVQGLRAVHESTPVGLRWLVWLLVQAPLRKLRAQAHARPGDER